MGDTTDGHLREIDERGYTVVEGAIDLDLVDALVDDLDRLVHDLGVVPASNAFEGTRTTRVYNLLAHGPHFEQIPVHPAILPICEGVLDPGLLVSSLSSIAIGPGETAQPIHADDQVLPLPKPHPATVCNTMWALTDFTEANGATRVIPGSHSADHSPDLTRTYDSIPAEMPRGSVLVWHGSLWHGGGCQHHVGATDRDRHELLRRLHPPTGEPAARASPGRPWPASPDVSRSSSATASTGDSSATSTSRFRPAVLLGSDTDPRLLWDRATPVGARAPRLTAAAPGLGGPADPGQPDGHRSSGSRPRVSGTHQNRVATRDDGDERDRRGQAEPVADVGHGTEDDQSDRGSQDPGHQEPPRHRGPHLGREQLVHQRADRRGEHRAGQDAEHVADDQCRPGAAVGERGGAGDADHAERAGRARAPPGRPATGRPAGRPAR